MSNKVQVAKLVTGEELIGRISVIEVDGYDVFKVESPRVFQVAGVKGDQLQVQLIPYLISEPDVNYVLIQHRSFVTLPREVTSFVENLYVQQTTSIQLTP